MPHKEGPRAGGAFPNRFSTDPAWLPQPYSPEAQTRRRASVAAIDRQVGDQTRSDQAPVESYMQMMANAVGAGLGADVKKLEINNPQLFGQAIEAINKTKAAAIQQGASPVEAGNMGFQAVMDQLGVAGVPGFRPGSKRIAPGYLMTQAEAQVDQARKDRWWNNPSMPVAATGKRRPGEWQDPRLQAIRQQAGHPSTGPGAGRFSPPQLQQSFIAHKDQQSSLGDLAKGVPGVLLEPIIPETWIKEDDSGIKRTIKQGIRDSSSVAAIALAAGTAGYGGAAATALRASAAGSAGRGLARRGLAHLVEPITGGGFAKNFPAEMGIEALANVGIRHAEKQDWGTVPQLLSGLGLAAGGLGLAKVGTSIGQKAVVNPTKNLLNPELTLPKVGEPRYFQRPGGDAERTDLVESMLRQQEIEAGRHVIARSGTGAEQRFGTVNKDLAYGEAALGDPGTGRYEVNRGQALEIAIGDETGPTAVRPLDAPEQRNARLAELSEEERAVVREHADPIEEYQLDILEDADRAIGNYQGLSNEALSRLKLKRPSPERRTDDEIASPFIKDHRPGSDITYKVEITKSQWGSGLTARIFIVDPVTGNLTPKLEMTMAGPNKYPGQDAIYNYDLSMKGVTDAGTRLSYEDPFRENEFGFENIARFAERMMDKLPDLTGVTSIRVRTARSAPEGGIASGGRGNRTMRLTRQQMKFRAGGGATIFPEVKGANASRYAQGPVSAIVRNASHVRIGLARSFPSASEEVIDIMMDTLTNRAELMAAKRNITVDEWFQSQFAGFNVDGLLTMRDGRMISPSLEGGTAGQTAHFLINTGVRDTTRKMMRAVISSNFGRSSQLGPVDELRMVRELETMWHEIGHVIRRDLYDMNPRSLEILARFSGEPTGDPGSLTDPNYHWSAEAEEKFARGFVTYIFGPNSANAQGLDYDIREAYALVLDWLRKVISEQKYGRRNLEDLTPTEFKAFDDIFYNQNTGVYDPVTAWWNNPASLVGEQEGLVATGRTTDIDVPQEAIDPRTNQLPEPNTVQQVRDPDGTIREVPQYDDTLDETGVLLTSQQRNARRSERSADRILADEESRAAAQLESENRQPFSDVPIDAEAINRGGEPQAYSSNYMDYDVSAQIGPEPPRFIQRQHASGTYEEVLNPVYRQWRQARRTAQKAARDAARSRQVSGAGHSGYDARGASQRAIDRTESPEDITARRARQYPANEPVSSGMVAGRHVGPPLGELDVRVGHLIPGIISGEEPRHASGAIWGLSAPTGNTTVDVQRVWPESQWASRHTTTGRRAVREYEKDTIAYEVRDDTSGDVIALVGVSRLQRSRGTRGPKEWVLHVRNNPDGNPDLTGDTSRLSQEELREVSRFIKEEHGDKVAVIHGTPEVEETGPTIDFNRADGGLNERERGLLSDRRQADLTPGNLTQSRNRESGGFLNPRVNSEAAVALEAARIRRGVQNLSDPTSQAVAAAANFGKRTIPWEEANILLPDVKTKVISTIRARGRAAEETLALRTKETRARVAASAGVRRSSNYTGEDKARRALNTFTGKGARNRTDQTWESLYSVEGGVTKDDMHIVWEWVNHHPVMREGTKANTTIALWKLADGRDLTQFDIQRLKAVFGKEVTQGLFDTRGFKRKAFDELMDILQIPRMLLATMDFSAVLRQGLLSLGGHPVRWAKTFGPAVGAALSDRAADSRSLRRQTQEHSALYYGSTSTNVDESLRGFGLSETDIDGPMSGREEAFMSRFLSKIPGRVGRVPIAGKVLKPVAQGTGLIFGYPIRFSNRGYNTFLNDLRFGLMDDAYQNWKSSGKGFDLDEATGELIPTQQTMKDGRDLARWFNISTGRGDLGPLEDFAPLLANILFSPRLVAARIEAPWELIRPDRSWRVRQHIARDMGGTLLMGSSVLAAAAAAGADVDLDPTSSDFGRIQVGNTRIDIWGGFQPLVRTFFRVAQQRRKSTGTGKSTDLDMDDLVQEIINFWRAKLAPVPGFGIDVAAGGNFTGDEINFEQDNVQRELIARFAPLIAQDMIEAWREDGVTGLALAAPSFFGTSVISYQGVEEVSRRDYTNPETLEPATFQDLPPFLQDHTQYLNTFETQNKLTDFSKQIEEYDEEYWRTLVGILADGDLSDSQKVSGYFQAGTSRAKLRAGAFRAMYGERQTPDEPRNDNEKAMNTYYRLAELSTEGDAGYNSAMFNNGYDELEDGWTFAQIQWVRANTNTKVIPKEMYRLLPDRQRRRIDDSDDARIQLNKKWSNDPSIIKESIEASRPKEADTEKDIEVRQKEIEREREEFFREENIKPSTTETSDTRKSIRPRFYPPATPVPAGMR